MNILMFTEFFFHCMLVRDRQHVSKRQPAYNNLQNYITDDIVRAVLFNENMDVVNIFSFSSVQSKVKNNSEH